MKKEKHALSFITDYFAEFEILKYVSREFWLINVIQFLDGLAYFSMITIITLYLTNNVGFSDYDSGKWVSIWALFVTAFFFAAGSICDLIGIKKSLLIGLSICLICRIGLALFPFVDGINASFNQIAVPTCLVLLALGMAFVSPIVQTGIRRYTKKKYRATGFNLYYLFMNIGAILANIVIIDGCRNYLNSTQGNLLILGIGAVATIGCLLALLPLRENNFAEESERIEPAEKKKTPLQLFSEVWSEKSFLKLVLFLFLTLGVRLVFTNQFLVMPKYYTRAIYEDYDLGFANGINPIIIVIGLIVLIPIINKYSTVKLMILGMAISAISLFILCIPPHYFLALPGITNLSQAFIFMIIVQIIIFAIGELIFMPRFTEYIASVAPKDKVASYMALSTLPMFIAKPINGFISGILIAAFCYEGIRAKIDIQLLDYTDSPEFMWLIYAALAIVSPVAVILIRRFIEESPSVNKAKGEGEEKNDTEQPA